VIILNVYGLSHRTGPTLNLVHETAPFFDTGEYHEEETDEVIDYSSRNILHCDSRKCFDCLATVRTEQ
jgi:hypothetical protein